MRYLPLLLVSAVLLGVVVLLSGDLERGKRVAGNIVVAVLVLTALAILLALVVRPLVNG